MCSLLCVVDILTPRNMMKALFVPVTEAQMVGLASKNHGKEAARSKEVTDTKPSRDLVAYPLRFCCRWTSEFDRPVFAAHLCQSCIAGESGRVKKIFYCRRLNEPRLFVFCASQIVSAAKISEKQVAHDEAQAMAIGGGRVNRRSRSPGVVGAVVY